MADGESVVASYSSYLDSFERALGRLGGASEGEEMVNDILRPFEQLRSDVLPAEDLKKASGLGLVEFAEGLRRATVGGLISIETVNGEEHVHLLPIGRAAMQAEQ
jgi:hypothetical protein